MKNTLGALILIGIGYLFFSILISDFNILKWIFIFRLFFGMMAVALIFSALEKDYE